MRERARYESEGKKGRKDRVRDDFRVKKELGCIEREEGRNTGMRWDEQKNEGLKEGQEDKEEDGRSEEGR